MSSNAALCEFGLANSDLRKSDQKLNLKKMT